MPKELKSKLEISTHALREEGDECNRRRLQ